MGGVVVSTLAGYPQKPGFKDGFKGDAQFNTPCGICVDHQGTIYVSDHYNHVVRKVSPEGAVSLLAGSGETGKVDNADPLLAAFYLPSGVSVDADKNLYVGDFSNSLVRKISHRGVETIGTNYVFCSPLGTGVDKEGNVFVADRDNNTIVKITPDGQAKPICRIHNPYGLCVSRSNNIYTATNSAVYKIREVGGIYESTLLASDFKFLLGAAVDDNDNVFVCDSGSNTIKKVSPSGVVQTIAGSGEPGYLDGLGDVARFKQPWGVAVDKFGCLYVSGWHNQCIRKIVPYENILSDWPKSHLSLSARTQTSVEELLLSVNEAYKQLPRELIYLLCRAAISKLEFDS